MENRHQQLAEKVRWKTLTKSLPRRCDGKPSPTACWEGAMENRHQQLAEKVRWKTVTNSLTRRCDGKPSPTRGAEWAFRCLDFTLFVIDMHQLMLILLLFLPHLTTFTFMCFWNPNKWIPWKAVLVNGWTRLMSSLPSSLNGAVYGTQISCLLPATCNLLKSVLNIYFFADFWLNLCSAVVQNDSIEIWPSRQTKKVTISFLLSKVDTLIG